MNPTIGSLWIHKKGGVYVVLMLSNTDSTRVDEYPPTVTYRRLSDLTTWSRPLSKWYSSMCKYPEIL